MEPENLSHPDANTPTPGLNAGVPDPIPETRAPAASVPDPAPENIKNDIAKILQEVKLPERRSGNLSQEKKHVIEVKSFDTALSAETRADIAQEKETRAAEPVAAPQGATPEAGSVTAVRTFKQDLQHVVREGKISVVRAASLEQEKMRPGPIEDNLPSPRPRSYKGIIVFSIVLLILGFAALFGVLFVMSRSVAPLPVQPSTSLVFAEQSVSYPIDGKSPTAIKAELALARNGGSSSLGSITRIIATQQSGEVDQSGNQTALPLNLSEFFAAIGANPPADLLRALGENYFFGIHTVDKNAPVLVIPVVSYDRAFAGMLSWESTMNRDLAPIFTQVPMNTVDENGIPTVRTFVDEVMRNYDVRELKDDAGVVQLYYSFPSRDMLVIAESPYTFTEILSRLQAGRTQ